MTADSGDITFTIAAHEQARDGSLRVTARRVHRNRAIGFVAVVLPRWEPWQVEGVPRVLHRGGITIEPDDAAGDHFVEALDELFGTGLAPGSMADRVFFSALALSGDPTSLASGPVKLKLFFDPGSPARYAEVYLNIDVPTGTVELNEKDPDYRENLVRALSGT